jgi:hypothetical protein
VIKGIVASIRWHHYVAAGVHGYTVAPCNKAGTAWDLVATVVLSDAFKLSQRPLTFVALRTKKGLDGTCVVKTQWSWPITAISPIDRNTQQVTARLGTPEEET